ncbi:MAG: DNA repair protein RadA [Lachnospiraceae bacterium]|nr:DNA repair protein RadA [Lachnospiraceae bacterium]
MAKASATTFFCRECGYESTKWVGQCPACRQWNTMAEAPKAASGSTSSRIARSKGRLLVQTPVTLDEIGEGEETRQKTGFDELDMVLGGGIVPASLILVGGDPGIGKSTILLQLCRNLAKDGRSVLYVSGEESLRQIRMRASRLGAFEGNIRFLSETGLDRVTDLLTEEKPEIVVIDSVQTMYQEEVSGAPGSITQVREATMTLLRIAKSFGITIFIVGHVTKEGTVAGPRMLEHIVDTVLYFEGDRNASYRIIRSAKNRFGSTNEVGVFEMTGQGLREVKNPSAFLLEGRPEGAPGSVVTCTMEGSRPLLLELQALVCKTSFGMPRRTAAGIDYNRVNLLMAVLEKRMMLRVNDCDAYLNVAGGMRVNEPALDLAIVMALASSYKDRPLPDDTLVIGEVGLAGEVRAVRMAERRVAEAIRMGFARCILPAGNLTAAGSVSAMGENGGIRLVGVRTAAEAIACLNS